MLSNKNIPVQVVNRPLLICLSSTRNYGWVTRAFLEYNTRWADFIIIVDQMSTDGTREMCAEYGDKVILIDDPDLTYHEAKRAQIAIARAREIPGDKILISLAIDEMLPANYQETTGWQRILNSEVGDMFDLCWANFLPDKIHYTKDESQHPGIYRVFHDDNTSSFESNGKEIHIGCLPMTGVDWSREFEIMDLPILHFGHYHEAWSYCKHKYYQMVDIVQHRSKSIISIHRGYYRPVVKCEVKKYKVPDRWMYPDKNIYDLVDIVSVPIIVDYMQELIQQYGSYKFAWLDIWEPRLMNYLHVQDPRRWYHKLFHLYLRKTRNRSKKFVIKAIDKVLKFIL